MDFFFENWKREKAKSSKCVAKAQSEIEKPIMLDRKLLGKFGTTHDSKRTISLLFFTWWEEGEEGYDENVFYIDFRIEATI